jgi:ATP-dependent RNA circularization protein (DNA/RNA ligase family)
MKHSAPQTIKIKKTTLKYTKEIIIQMKTMFEISLAYKLQRLRRQQIQTNEQRHHMTKTKNKRKNIM